MAVYCLHPPLGPKVCWKFSSLSQAPHSKFSRQSKNNCSRHPKWSSLVCCESFEKFYRFRKMIRPVNKILKRKSMFMRISVINWGFFRRNLDKKWLKRQLVSLQFRILIQSSGILRKVEGWKKINRGCWGWMRNLKLWFLNQKSKLCLFGKCLNECGPKCYD